MVSKFRIIKELDSSKARLGLCETAHGVMETPLFIPVASRGAVKTLTNQHLFDLGVEAIVSNAYHLMLRPGAEIISKAGGLHRFMNWPRPLLTNSGGFQIFSIAELNQVTENGVFFQSHIDGSKQFFGPLESMRIQKAFGSDLVMAFDECLPYPCERKIREKSLERTHRWAQICRNYELEPFQSLFGVLQGGDDVDLRAYSARELTSLNFDGYAIGGVWSGNSARMLNPIIEAVEPLLPKEKPRYLMGVGTPRNIIEAVMRGVDMFDCVMPTRNARNGTAFTWSGKVNIKAGRYADDFSPLDAQLNCYTSQFSRAYIRHLINVDELTGLTLVTLQNLAFYLDFMQHIRQAIRQDSLNELYQYICGIYPE